MSVAEDVRPRDPRVTFISTDTTLVYTPFFADFGPFDLGLIYTFCKQLKDLLNKSNKPVVYYCVDHMHRKANAAVLICSYMIIIEKASVENAYKPFFGINFVPFRDAGFSINTYPCTVLDCICAIHHSISENIFQYEKFSLKSFQKLRQLEDGDFSWVIPGKFIAFSGPREEKTEISPGCFTLSPFEYIPRLKRLGVTCVVRFNSSCYDSRIFLQSGIHHFDLCYEDGGIPTEAILQKFLYICEREKGAIAVHCKAGLGRTMTNIAAYMIKHYGYSAREAIAWCRICRPGSIIGPQQQFLLVHEEKLRTEGLKYKQYQLEMSIVIRSSSMSFSEDREIVNASRKTSDASKINEEIVDMTPCLGKQSDTLVNVELGHEDNEITASCNSLEDDKPSPRSIENSEEDRYISYSNTIENTRAMQQPKPLHQRLRQKPTPIELIKNISTQVFSKRIGSTTSNMKQELPSESNIPLPLLMSPTTPRSKSDSCVAGQQVINTSNVSDQVSEILSRSQSEFSAVRTHSETSSALTSSTLPSLRTTK